MSGEMITFSHGGTTYAGYLARAKSGAGPGVIVIQEWWGLVGHIKGLADRLAEDGFTALAPDFYAGRTTAEPEEAGKLMMALNIDNTEKILASAVETLLAHEAVTGAKVGVAGFCMGGQLSLYAATLNDKIGACADFYGIHPAVHPNLENLHCPLLGIFATRDGYATPEMVSALDEELTELGKPHTFRTFEADHAFCNDDRPEVYEPAAAEDAWMLLTSFMREAL
jgi:carboxymethylenebutenolidase